MDIKSLGSHIVCKYFLLFFFFSIISFAVQKLLSLIKLDLFIFDFIFFIFSLGTDPRNIAMVYV